MYLRHESSLRNNRLYNRLFLGHLYTLEHTQTMIEFAHRLRDLSKPLEHLEKRWWLFIQWDLKLKVSEPKYTNKMISTRWFVTRHSRAKIKIIHFLASFFDQTFGWCSPILQWSKISKRPKGQVKTSEMVGSYLHQNRKGKLLFWNFTDYKISLNTNQRVFQTPFLEMGVQKKRTELQWRIQRVYSRGGMIKDRVRVVRRE